MNIDNIIIAVISFFAGNVSGYLLHDFLKRTLNMDEKSSKNFLMIIVTLVWAVGMVVDILGPQYEVPIAVHGLLGAIVGFFFYKPKQN